MCCARSQGGRVLLFIYTCSPVPVPVVSRFSFSALMVWSDVEDSALREAGTLQLPTRSAPPLSRRMSSAASLCCSHPRCSSSSRPTVYAPTAPAPTLSTTPSSTAPPTACSTPLWTPPPVVAPTLVSASYGWPSASRLGLSPLPSQRLCVASSLR